MVSPLYPRRPVSGFTLVELLVVIAIIAILLGASAALVPSMLHGNQMNSDVTTLQGILEEARETALASNTYVYVGFTTPAANPTASAPDGVSVIAFESQDGLDVLNNFANSATLPQNDLQMLNRIQRLPGVQIVDVGNVLVTASGYTPPTANGTPVDLGGLSTSGTTITWKFTTTSTLTFACGFEFCPNGEAKVPVSANPPTWYDEFQFALAPAVKGLNGKDVAVIRISRVTGKATIYRP